MPIQKKLIKSYQAYKLRTFNIKSKQVALHYVNVNHEKVESIQKYNYLKSACYWQILLE